MKKARKTKKKKKHEQTHTEVVIVSFWYIQIDQTLNTSIIVSTHNSISFVDGFISSNNKKEKNKHKISNKKKIIYLMIIIVIGIISSLRFDMQPKKITWIHNAWVHTAYAWKTERKKTHTYSCTERRIRAKTYINLRRLWTMKLYKKKISGATKRKMKNNNFQL